MQCVDFNKSNIILKTHILVMLCLLYQTPCYNLLEPEVSTIELSAET
jgi:hypothetical protein